MKIAKKLLLGASCAMLLANTAFAALPEAQVPEVPAVKAEEAAAETAVAQIPVQNVLVTSGKIVSVEGEKITVKGEGNQPVVSVIVGDNTYLLDGKDGDSKKMKSLKVGKEVTVYYSPVMTRSLPPQSQAFAIVLGKNTPKLGKFFQVAEVLPAENAEAVRLLNSNHDVIATVSKDVCKDYRSIKEGNSLMLWYNVMTMSLPGQTNAEKVVILPELE